MNNELYDYLEKYFKVWIKNITENQIVGFTKQMEQAKNHSMIQH